MGDIGTFTDLFRDSTAVVQLAVNQLVVGSIPTPGANKGESDVR